MPQMFPLFWFLLFSSASLALLISLSSLYYNTEPKIFQTSSHFSQKFHNWKW